MLASHTCLNLFEKFPVLEPFFLSNAQQTFPVNSLNEASIDFQIETNRKVFSDLCDTFLSLKVKLFKDANQPIVDGDNTYMVNTITDSLFSNLEVHFNNITHQLDNTLTNLFYRMSFLVLKVQKIQYQFAKAILMKKIHMMLTMKLSRNGKKFD